MERNEFDKWFAEQVKTRWPNWKVQAKRETRAFFSLLFLFGPSPFCKETPSKFFVTLGETSDTTYYKHRIYFELCQKVWSKISGFLRNPRMAFRCRK